MDSRWRDRMEPNFNFNVCVIPWTDGNVYGIYYDDDIEENRALLNDIADEYQPYSGAPIHKKEFEDFKNSMKFIPYVSVVETTSSQDISENGTYFVIPTNPSDASIKLEVKAGPQGTLQTAYFSGGIISVYRNYDHRFQMCEAKIVYGAGSSAASTFISDGHNYSSLPSGILSRITGKCKIYKL